MNACRYNKKILKLVNIVMNLKNVKRSGWINKFEITSPESVADHSYCVAFISMIIADLEELDSKKILQMSLLHDLAESITGDFTPENRPMNKHHIENQIVTKILQNLPKCIRITYLNLWQEYIENKTIESALVHDVDKLELTCQAILYSKNNKLLKLFLHDTLDLIQNQKLKKFLRKYVTNSSNE